jgi:hypothetical protein
MYSGNCASVVIAKNEEEARQMLDDALVKKKLNPSSIIRYDLTEISKSGAYILNDGDY